MTNEKKDILFQKSSVRAASASFYDNVAKIIGISDVNKAVYDCRKLSITKKVLDCLYKFYHSENQSDETITTCMLLYGPKSRSGWRWLRSRGRRWICHERCVMAGVELRDYQEDAVRQMRNGCILCGGVGSGKSRTSLAYYYVRNGGELGTNEYVPMDDVNIKDLYIITTARKRDTFEWEEELSPFLLSTNKKENLYTNKVVIDSWNNIKKYADVKDAFFIFDEQRVIGSGTWVKSILENRQGK